MHEQHRYQTIKPPTTYIYQIVDYFKTLIKYTIENLNKQECRYVSVGIGEISNYTEFKQN